MIGKHFILTGSTSGLGKSILKQLLAKKVNVTVLVRNSEKLKDVIEKYGMSHLSIIQCDLQSTEAIYNITKQLKSQKFDGLIYCSGLGYFKTIAHHTSKEMLETYQLNVIHFNILLEILKPYLTNYPSIIGISSQAAFVTQASAAHYGASKAAFYQTLNALRIECPNYHILTVNTGPIDTPFHKKADPSNNYANKYRKIMLNADELAKK